MKTCNHHWIFIAFILLISCDVNSKKSLVSILNLRCEYLTNPLGIDEQQPSLSWELKANERDQEQTAYQILVASNSELLTQNIGDLWNSGKVESNQTNQIIYNGQALKSRMFCYWKVMVWDKNGRSSNWSPVSYWSVGLLNKNDWQAKWIGAKPEQIPKEQQYYINHGYSSSIASSANVDKWIILDLGKDYHISEVRLYPVHPLKQTERGRLIKDDKNNTEVYLFPLQFSIDISGYEDFREFKTVAEESIKDYIHQTNLEPYTKHFDPQKARYVRIRCHKLAQIDAGSFAFALAELEVLNNSNENIALGKPIKESDIFPKVQPIPRENWSARVLVDGFFEANDEKSTVNIPIPPSQMVRKEFEISKNVKRAMLYITSLGVYEARINGEKVGDQILAPEWTDYDTRVQYQTYDVTNLIRNGKNALCAMLADGWYAGALFSHHERGGYGFDRRLLGQLEIDYTDGTNKLVTTDENWKISADGPIRTASIFDGELYNANFKQVGWDESDFDDTAWENVTVDTSISVKLNAQMNEPIKIVKELEPVEIFERENGTYIVDMGQNMVGWIELSLPFNTNKEITLRYGEILDTDSSLYTLNLRRAKQTDIYIPGKEEKIQYQPRFTYHGFRYVEISGLTKPPIKNNIAGIVVASSSPNVGVFKSSHKGINKLWENILWTQRGNMHSTLTDCPQRDERSGWTGDAQVFSQTAIFNMDMAAFYKKWIRDLRDDQSEDGRFPDWAPKVDSWWNQYNSPAWADAAIIVPWKIYQNYGDIEVLRNHYGAMKKYIHHILEYNPDLIWRVSRGGMYGDWLNGDNIISGDYPETGGKVPNDVFSTAFFANSTRILAKTAKVLNIKEDLQYYDSLATAIQHAFVNEFINDDGTIEGNTQAGYALALEFNLVPMELKEKAAANMVEAIKAYDYRMSTGIQSTIRLMQQLSAFGFNDIAYRLLESRRLPSWLYSVDQGATTIWERWDGYVEGRGFQNPGMNSFSHVAFGAVGEWLYEHILGIQLDETNPGYRHFSINPVPGGSITWAKGSYHSIAGNIIVSWKRNSGSFILDLEVPVNTSASVFLPTNDIGKIMESGKPVKRNKQFKLIDSVGNQTILKVGSGQYSFNCSIN